MGSFQHRKQSDSKRCSVKVRWGIFIEIFDCIFLFLRAVVTIPIQTLIISPWILVRNMINSQLELGPPVLKYNTARKRSRHLLGGGGWRSFTVFSWNFLKKIVNSSGHNHFWISVSSFVIGWDQNQNKANLAERCWKQEEVNFFFFLWRPCCNAVVSWNKIR